jgi:zinc and cadmium transporter
MTDLIVFSLIGGVFSLLGGLVLLWKPHLTRKVITPLIAFGTGAFLGAAFLDLLPEAVEMTDEPHGVFVAVLIGFLAFFTFERLVMRFIKGKNASHEHSEHTEPLPYLLILGDSLHNFLDGVVIAIAYAANPALGLPTALAIAAHEVPQEIGDFSIMLHLGWNRSRVIAVNAMQSLMILPGILVGHLIGRVIEPQLPMLLGITAGIFIYIAASDLIPELHHHAGHKQLWRIILPMAASIGAVYWVVGMAH